MESEFYIKFCFIVGRFFMSQICFYFEMDRVLVMSMVNECD